MTGDTSSNMTMYLICPSPTYASYLARHFSCCGHCGSIYLSRFLREFPLETDKGFVAFLSSSLGVVAAGFLVEENCGIFLVVLTVKGGKNLPKRCVRCVLYIYDLR